MSVNKPFGDHKGWGGGFSVSVGDCVDNEMGKSVEAGSKVNSDFVLRGQHITSLMVIVLCVNWCLHQHKGWSDTFL